MSWNGIPYKGQRPNKTKKYTTQMVIRSPYASQTAPLSYTNFPNANIKFNKYVPVLIPNKPTEKNNWNKGRALINSNLTNNAVKGLLKLKTSKTRRSSRKTKKNTRRR